MLNKVILIGNLGSDPDYNGEHNVCNCSLATSETYKTQQGEKKTNTEWHNLEIWGKSAEVFSQYLSKGDKIYVEGKIKTVSWEMEDGSKRYKTVIQVREFKFLTTKNTQNNNSQSAPEAPEMDDDLPF